MNGTQCFSARHLPGQPVEPTVSDALASAGEFAARCGLPPDIAARLAVVVDELVGNLLRHGQAACEVQLAMTMCRSGGGVTVTLEDNCVPFDPREASFGGPDEQSGGGVGLALVRALSQIEAYEQRDGVNRLSLRLGAG